MFTLQLSGLTLALICIAVLTYFIGPLVPMTVFAGLLFYGIFRSATRVQRKPWMPLSLAVLTVLILTPGFAFAATIDIGQALTGSLQDIINGTVTALIAALIGWVAIVIKNKFGLDIEAAHRDALTAFLQRQASALVAQGAVKLSGVKIEVQNDALAAAANTALNAIPDALKFFGLTPEKIQAMIIDLLPKQPAVAQAAAVAIDTANPATPTPAI